MSVGEKVAYLRGLADGLKLDASKDEGKLIFAVIDALESVSEELDALRTEQTELSETLDAVSDDLADVEELFSGDDGARYSATCPACQETVYFGESALEEGEILCPNCGQKLEFDLDDSGDETDEIGDAESGETPSEE